MTPFDAIGRKVNRVQDMHYADFAEDDVGPMIQLNYVLSVTGGEQSAALLQAIKEYEASKWKVIGQKVGKPAKVGCSLNSQRFHSIMTEFFRLVSNMRRSILEARFDEVMVLRSSLQ